MNQANILFFTKINFGNKQNAGYHNKVRAQANALRKSGMQVDLMYFSNLECVLENPGSEQRQSFSSRLALLWYMFVKFPFSLQKNRYDGLYIRHFLTNPLFLIMLLIFRLKGTVIILELPTFPYAFEYRGWNKNRLLYLTDRLCSLFFRCFVSRIVTFSFDENIYGIATIRTDNGVEVDKIHFSENVPEFHSEFRLLGLGNPRIWHAYERIIEGMKIYYESKPETNFIFEVVGQGGELEKYRQMVENYGLQDKVIFHGFQSGKALDEICSQCHMAAASMGMHRINVAKGEASPLKAREFAARGIPFIAAYTDKGFPANFPYILSFPPDESDIDIASVISFYQKLVDSHPHYRSEMRNFASQNLDWSSKMKPVADYFKQHISIINT